MQAQSTQFTSPEEKEAWIKAHPEEYKSMSYTPSMDHGTDVPAAPDMRPSADRPVGFPEYKETGNPEADQAAYAKAKEAYLKSHPVPASTMPAPLMPPAVEPEAAVVNTPARVVSNDPPYQYTPRLKDSEIPAEYREAADFSNPAVRERIENQILNSPKSGTPQGTR